MSRTLRGMMKAAAHRFDLCLNLTAGYDSRCVLAASRDIVADLSFCTNQHIGMPAANSVDITVASSLLRKLHLKHDLIKADITIDDKFLEAYTRCVKYPHMRWYPEAQATFKFYEKKKVDVVGGASEIGRCYYKTSNFAPREAGKTLASMTAMGWHPFGIRRFQNWFDGLVNITDIPILDLFYWENRVGSWLSMCQAEWDIATQDIFTPFNCRNLLTQMLGVKMKHRCNAEYSFHRALISTLWMDVLAEPINPHPINPFATPFEKWVRSCLSLAKRTIRSGRY